MIMMDLKARGPLKAEEQELLVTAIQTLVLGELMQAEQWRAGNVAFHGGSAIKTAYGSARWSEDLDFMLGSRLREQLIPLAGKIKGSLDRQFGVLTPGCKVGLKVKAAREGADDIIDAWSVTWTHDNRIGKALVKVEFCTVQADSLLCDYDVTMSTLTCDGQQLPGRMPVGTTVSLWADKIKAMATRPEIKWRDAHDIAYLLGKRAVQDASNAELLRALEITGAIYRKSLADIRAGLETRLDGGDLDRTDLFVADMAKWFSGDLHATYLRSDAYRHMLADTKREMERVVAELDACLSPQDQESVPEVKP